MTSNPDQIVQHVQHEFQQLIAYVTTAESRTRTAYHVELTLGGRLLALGAALLRLFFVTRAAVRPPRPLSPSGQALPYHDQRSIDYYSIFGKLCFTRHYFYAVGLGGECPLDAALSLPERCYSDLLRDWVGYQSTDSAYRESRSTVSRILGLDLNVAALQASVREDACDVAAFYQRPLTPAATPLGTILVAQADGKGVPMVQPPAFPSRCALGQRAEAHQDERGDRDRALHDCALCAHGAGCAGGLAARSPPGRTAEAAPSFCRRNCGRAWPPKDTAGLFVLAGPQRMTRAFFGMMHLPGSGSGSDRRAKGIWPCRSSPRCFTSSPRTPPGWRGQPSPTGR